MPRPRKHGKRNRERQDGRTVSRFVWEWRRGNKYAKVSATISDMGVLNVQSSPAEHVPEDARHEAVARMLVWLGGCFNHDSQSVYCLLWG